MKSGADWRLCVKETYYLESENSFSLGARWIHVWSLVGICMYSFIQLWYLLYSGHDALNSEHVPGTLAMGQEYKLDWTQAKFIHIHTN